MATDREGNAGGPDGLLRVEAWRTLVARFNGNPAPIPAVAAFEILRGHKIGPAAMSHRRAADRLPWSESVEIQDGPRRLVPLVAVVDCLIGTSGRVVKPMHRPRGRPRKNAPRFVETPE